MINKIKLAISFLMTYLHIVRLSCQIAFIKNTGAKAKLRIIIYSPWQSQSHHEQRVLLRCRLAVISNRHLRHE